MLFDVWTIGVAIAIQAFGLASAGHALLTKRDPQPALGWVVVCVTLPVVGAVVYWLFGVNYIQTRAQRLHHPTGPRPSDTAAATDSARAPERYHQLARVGTAVTGLSLLAGNRIEPLVDGDLAFPAMLAAIDGATTSIALSSYIFATDDTGMRFIDALAAATERGVTVRVLIDGIGDLYSWPRSSKQLRRRGVRAVRFLPPTLGRPGLHMNLRNHRKLLVVDGRHGFTGGMNIGDRHASPGDGRPPKVRDVHFRVEGPVVTQLEAAFLQDWAFATGETAAPLDPGEVAPAGEALARGLTEGPSEDYDKLEWVLVQAINTAHERVRVMTPYFLPSRQFVTALNVAALRGVRVEVFLPERNNLPFVAWATRAMLWQLLQRGVRVYLQPPPFVHTKLFVVDDDYAQVGSANLDTRSLRLNFEFNIEVYDTRLGGVLAAHFERARAASRPLYREELDARWLPAKLRDAAFWLFTPYL